jgi:hypothetical protein
MVTAINLETLGVSEYALDWLDVAVLGTTVYGLTASQVERLSAAADKPDCYVEWGQLSLPDDSAGFTLPLCRMRGLAIGAVELRTLGEEYGIFQERVYSVAGLEESVARDRQELLARDIDFTSVAISLEGRALELSALRLAVDRVQDWRR